MQRIHLAVGACVAALAGAVSGATINTTPLARGIDGWDHVPRHELSDSAIEAEERSAALPDHYPLITPNGRIEVSELRDHGLYRNRRYGARWTAGWYEPDEEPAYTVVEADYRYVPDERFDSMRRTATPVPAPAQPLDLEEPALLAADAAPMVPAQVAQVKPRTIDVTAALAARN